MRPEDSIHQRSEPVRREATGDQSRGEEAARRSRKCEESPAESEPPCGDLLEKILERENLGRAWKKVRANGGAAGVDGMDIEGFPAFARAHWEEIASKLREGRYAPARVRRVMIPKGGGKGERPLGIPTVVDRVIQQAMAQVLGPIFEPHFSEQSYGFRPGKSAHDAIRTVSEGPGKGRRQAVDCDLKSFFDTVNHEKLMALVGVRVRDPDVLALIRACLRAGVVLANGQREETCCGVPQGGPLSPLLANIMLDPLDQELEKRGHHFARYADDAIVLVKSPRAAKRVLASISGFVEKKLKLVVNRAKSGCGPLEQSVYLGFCVLQGKVRVSEAAMGPFKRRIREITKRSWGVSMKERLETLRLYVVGWSNYYGIGLRYREVLALDQWLRRRVRLCYWKQWERPKTQRRELLRLGADAREVQLASASRKGFWRMSGNSIVQRAMSNQWLAAQGVPSMKSRWIAIHHENP